MCSASSCTAFTPFSGSTPACAQRPVTIISAVPTPFRAVFNRPLRPKEGSSTSTASLRRASLVIARRELALPISSSEVHKNTNFFAGVIPASFNASTAKRARTSPPFMSNVPGPHARPPEIRNGIFASVPRGYTVSKCPKTMICRLGSRP